jgi:hypothetical protein
MVSYQKGYILENNTAINKPSKSEWLSKGTLVFQILYLKKQINIWVVFDW